MTNSSALFWRRATLLLLFILAAIIALWQLIPEPTVEHAILAVVFCTPLLAPLPGLWRGTRNTYRWATFCVLPYFIIGVTEAIADPGPRVWPTAMLVLALAWFAALIAYLRTSSAESQADNTSP